MGTERNSLMSIRIDKKEYYSALIVPFLLFLDETKKEEYPAVLPRLARAFLFTLMLLTARIENKRDRQL